MAQHLIANTPGNVPTSTPGNADPFTSSGAYRPAAPAAPGGGSGNVDPFTSSGAYRPSAATAPSSSNGAGKMDGSHLTAKRYRPGDADAARAAASAPALPFLNFDACKHDAVLSKLVEFNAELAAAGSAAALDAASITKLTSLVAKVKDSSMYHASKISEDEMRLFVGAAGGAGGLLSWPAERLFPALDLLRCALLHPSAAALVSVLAPPLIPTLLDRLKSTQPPANTDKPAGAARLMVLRALVNASSRPESGVAIAECATEILDALAPSLEHGPPPARLAVSSLLVNLTSILKRGGLSPAASAKAEAATLQTLSLVSLALAGAAPVSEEESMYRLLSALGAAIALDGGMQTARDLELGDAIENLALGGAAAKVVELVGRLKAQLKSG